MAGQAMIGALRVTLGLDTATFTKGWDNAQKKTASGAASIQKSLGTLTRTFTGLATAAGVTFGAAGALVAARGMLRIADEAKSLEAQLRLATVQVGSFAQATDDVRRIAETTRSGLSSTAALYGAINRNAQELGITQAQAARATETVAKAFRVSGAGADEASNATRQLLQALQSGVLRGDEFNSVMENSPRLARLLADSLGVPIGQLRAMAEAGELTSDKLVRALTDRKFTAGLDAEFKEMPVTFDQAMQQVENAAIITFGAFDRGGEFSTMLANFITDGTGGFTELEDAAEKLGIEVKAELAGLASAFEPMLSGALGAFSQINASAKESRDYIAGLLETLDTVANFGRNTLNGVAVTVQQTRNFLAPGTSSWGLQPAATGAPSNLAGRYRRASQLSADRGNSRRAERAVDQMFERVQGRAPSPGSLMDWVRGNGTRSARPSVGGGAKKKTRGGRKGPSAETLAKRAEAARVGEDRRQQAFDNELADSDRDVLAARRALVTSAEMLAQLERQDIEVARAKYDDNLKSQVSTKKLTESEAEQLRLRNDELAGLKLQAVDLRERERLQEEAARREDASADIQRDRLRAEAQLAETAAERREVELRILDAAYEEERRRLTRITQESKDANERAIAQMKLDALPDQYGADRAGVMRGTMGPMESYLSSLPDTAAKANEALEAVAAGGVASIVDGLAEAAVGARSLGEVFSGIAKQIIADLIRIQIQKAIVGGLNNALGGLFGSKTTGNSAFSGFDLGAQIGGAKADIDMSGLPGFATGGSFKVGGLSGIDKNLIAFRATRGEMVNISKGGDGQRQSPAIIQIVGDEGAAFVPRVAGISGNVSVETVRSANMAAARRGRQRLA